jgi:hypothetical protein
MAANMEFFQRKADELLNEGKRQQATKFKVLANEAAQQLAPYVHSKMPTLVVQSNQTTQQYVMCAQCGVRWPWAHAFSDARAPRRCEIADYSYGPYSWLVLRSFDRRR